MKILLINSLYKPDRRGGAEVLTELTAEALIKNGYQVSVICCAKEKNDLVEDIEGVNVFRLKPRNIFSFQDLSKHKSIVRLFWHLMDQHNFSQGLEVGKIIEKEKPDLIICHNLKGLGYFVPFVIAGSKTPCIQTLHDIQLVYPSGLLIKGEENKMINRNPLLWLNLMMNKRLFSYCKNVITPSAWLKDFYLARGFFKKSRFEVIRNPFASNVEMVTPVITENKNVYGCIGQMEEYKGVRFLIEVFEEFHKNNPETKIILAGNGSLLDSLKEKYKNQTWIEFLGRVEHSQLAEKFFNRIGWMVFPSLTYENAPNVVVESMQAGVPVIVSNIGGSAELVEHGRNGLIFEPGNKEDLLNQLNRSLLLNNSYQEVADECVQTVKNQTFDQYWEAMVKLAGI